MNNASKTVSSIHETPAAAVDARNNEFVIEELPGFELALLQGHDESVFFS